MKRYLRDSMIIFGIVLVALFVFLQTAFGARGLYSSQNLDYDKGYYYESDDFHFIHIVILMIIHQNQI